MAFSWLTIVQLLLSVTEAAPLRTIRKTGVPGVAGTRKLAKPAAASAHSDCCRYRLPGSPERSKRRSFQHRFQQGSSPCASMAYRGFRQPCRIKHLPAMCVIDCIFGDHGHLSGFEPVCVEHAKIVEYKLRSHRWFDMARFAVVIPSDQLDILRTVLDRFRPGFPVKNSIARFPENRLVRSCVLRVQLAPSKADLATIASGPPRSVARRELGCPDYPRMIRRKIQVRIDWRICRYSRRLAGWR